MSERLRKYGQVRASGSTAGNDKRHLEKAKSLGVFTRRGQDAREWRRREEERMVEAILNTFWDQFSTRHLQTLKAKSVGAFKRRGRDVLMLFGRKGGKEGGGDAVFFSTLGSGHL